MKTAIIAATLFLAAVGVYFFTTQSAVAPSPQETIPELYVAEGEYPNLTVQLAESINKISPTPYLDDIGWIVHRISFVRDRPFAYLEYTDTKVALRLLLQYYYLDSGIKTKVLATFIPTEHGEWELDHGKDLDGQQQLVNFIFDGDAKQWAPEEVSNNK